MSINWLLSTAELDYGNRFLAEGSWVSGMIYQGAGDVAGATSLVSFKHSHLVFSPCRGPACLGLRKAEQDEYG